MAKEIKIAQGQYLSDVLKAIPSNVLLNKQITGCGATTLEIDAPRHSIIIEPNVPVIRGKAEKYPHVLPVYEAISMEQVVAYLQKEGWRKIVTTPEGFGSKVCPALENVWPNYQQDFFLLFDECEKIIQDVGYRGDIALPIDDFFAFSKKAMVSATPIIPSDPRFREQGFSVVKIQPTYDYKQHLNLCFTNNTVEVLDRFIAKHKEHICVFINSTDTILRIIERLHLEERSQVYCSEKSVKKLREKGYNRCYDILQDQFAEICFFTSRFYSAVDIELPYKPYVVILSEVIGAPFSAIDPATEVVQAIGRFRKGTASICHITNLAPKMAALSKADLTKRLESHEKVYQQIYALPAQNRNEIEAKKQALRGMDHKIYMTPQGKRNYFMWDNAFDDARIKQYYQNKEKLERAYSNAPFHVKTYTQRYYLTDADRTSLETPTKSKSALWREVIRVARKIYKKKGGHVTEDEIVNIIGEKHRDKIHSCFLISAKEIERLNYKESAIKKAVQQKEHLLRVKSELWDDVHRIFQQGKVETVAQINSTMKKLLDQHSIEPYGRVDKRYIELFFKIREGKRKGARCIQLLNKRRHPKQ
ncbi:MAG: hypothetical protein IKZ12_05430 [Alistipes sp.]|nr:hypothetical protein [Alistipes sp.]